MRAEQAVNPSSSSWLRTLSAPLFRCKREREQKNVYSRFHSANGIKSAPRTSRLNEAVLTLSLLCSIHSGLSSGAASSLKTSQRGRGGSQSEKRSAPSLPACLPAWSHLLFSISFLFPFLILALLYLQKFPMKPFPFKGNSG